MSGVNDITYALDCPARAARTPGRITRRPLDGEVADGERAGKRIPGSPG